MSEISPKRKNLYAVGIGMTVLGVLLFVGGFASFLFFEPSFNHHRPPPGVFMCVGGMVLLILGQGIRAIAARGVAGSGLVLDPKKARKDLEPWAKMGGGIVRDVLDESGLAPKQKSQQLPFDEELRRLKSLRDDGLISDAEFEAGKAKIMSRI